VPDRAVDFVLFDLGGVLIELGGLAAFRELAGLGSDEEMWERWLGCPWVRRFERGGCTPDEFAEGVVADWQLGVPPDRFLQIFEAWPIGPFAGSAALLEDVQGSVPIGCCSNTNVVHWSYQSQHWPLLEVFDHSFLSFELGLVKPDREMFEAVGERVPAEPDRVLFLDDVVQNVDAARSYGFRAEQVHGPEQCRAVLEGLGLCPG
jgi:putative hydrolase of the HAD superfamily